MNLLLYLEARQTLARLTDQSAWPGDSPGLWSDLPPASLYEEAAEELRRHRRRASRSREALSDEEIDDLFHRMAEPSLGIAV